MTEIDASSGRSLRRCVLAALAALVVSGAVAASADAASGPTAWARSANVACAKANAAIEALPVASSLTVELADFRATVTIGIRETAALAALPRPSGDRRAITTFVALNGDGVPLGREMIAALEGGHSATLAVLEKRAGSLNDRYNALARQLDARTCAVNPQPRATRQSSAGPAA